MKKSNAKPLFDLSKEETPKKKRGRPRKTDLPNVEQDPVKEVKKVKEKTKTIKQKVREEIDPDDIGWKDFSKSKPELLTPVEFYVDTGKKKKDIFRGYIKTPGETITDEPYKLVVLRKKHGNLYYRNIDGCNDIMQCPREFPYCEYCEKKKMK